MPLKRFVAFSTPLPRAEAREIERSLDRRTFRLVVVRDDRETGVASSSEPDATIDYAGKTTSVSVRFRP